MENDTDSDIANFCAITSATPQVARDYLQVSDNNLEMAITLYLENGGNTLTSSMQDTTTTTTTSAPAANLSTDNITENNSPGNEVMSDEALARQLQDQEESRRRPAQQQSNEVRAPIAPRTEILTGAGGGDGSLFDMSMNYGGGGAMEGLWGLGGAGGRGRRQQQQNDRPSIFNQGDSSSMMTNSPINIVRSAAIAAGAGGSHSNSSSNSNNSSRSSSRHSPLSASPTGGGTYHNDDGGGGDGSGSGSITSSARAKRLADLFRPPFDIMFRGGFEEARAAAREQNKWLLVNVQDPTEFACQVLNRDLWSDSFVKDIVRESFVFLQYGNETADGKRYLTLYPISHYPHVAIIDSRTGERIKFWEKQLEPTDFMMEVTEFLEQHSPEAAKSDTMNKSKKPKNQLSEMSEEEQLNAAIAASLNSSQEANTSLDGSTKNESPTTNNSMELDGDDDNDDEDEPTASSSVLDSILPVKRQETTDIANSTRIQFRMADGSRVIRRFLKSDPVRYLFEFIKSHVPETQDQAFELVFNRQQLIDILDQGIQEAGLQNAAVNVQFA
ncbi:hypothetical protein BCR42DRAFT_418046 [Absidia repens]|uniref:UBX domain-containing protein n=1 Tax=Absidia repens TaxID=90262 RepID=A0A1X2ICR4_9FUNG|nr:hypothetical protein BCR42DRAFT_418046 [Absidia repens]